MINNKLSNADLNRRVEILEHYINESIDLLKLKYEEFDDRVKKEQRRLEILQSQLYKKLSVVDKFICEKTKLC